MTRNPAASWFPVAFQFWQLYTEASTVIWLRSLRLMEGGAVADREAERMISEKLQANADLAMKLAFDMPTTPEATATKAIRHYRGRVGANRRRLTARRK